MPIAVESGNELAAGKLRPVRPPPGGPGSSAIPMVLQVPEERLPLGTHRRRIGRIALVEVLDIPGVAAIEERGAGKSGIGILAGHGASDWKVWCEPIAPDWGRAS